MSDLFSLVADNAVVYYRTTADSAVEKCRLMDFDGLRFISDEGVEGRLAATKQWVIWCNPPLYGGDFKQLAEEYGIDCDQSQSPMKASSLRQISIDHINPMSKVLRAERNSPGLDKLKVLDAYIRAHESHPDCFLDNHAHYLNGMADFKSFCTKLKKHANLDSHGRCTYCNGKNLNSICNEIYDVFAEDVKKGSKSTYFGIQLMDYSENCRRSNYSDEENRLLHKIIKKLNNKIDQFNTHLNQSL